ncbi:meiotic cell cortex C-terminal pleckstrin homology-domain-containing protein [Glomus cerebriforme]|uniref:Meiotic cell cortex C-terminal pleckstrin homology-domain-containing protein n=1 Tax=Glomus cerebriforme TaxID=658196 RepID=A0A397TFB4_9GLOM|nr:meiotic cell cortex C-terminal pleckstrin homology-domain-containing protein [Glomus cerebriforme]
MADTIESNENSTASTPIRMSTHEGLGPDIVVSSPSTPRRSIYLQSPAAIKKQLQDQLNEKENQIQMTAELGQTLVKQQTELEQRIKELDQTQGEEVPQELRDKIAELEKALEATTPKVRGLTSSGIDLAGSTGSPGPSATSMADSTPTTTTGRNRRELNKAKKRKDDIELATEIGQGLLVEIRRLQALLQEKEERIKELEIDKADLERTIDLLNKQIRGKEESEERYKDENWNLELMKQEMSAQLEDLQQQLVKARNDYSKIEKALAAATDVIEQLKDKEERLTTEYYNLKTRHEQDMANNRRHVAALNREKNDLLKSLEDLRAQLASLQATRNMRKRTPEPGSDPNDDEIGQPITSDNDISNEGTPTALQGKNLNKEETLKALGIAKDMIGSLRANLQKEKSEKYELKKLLADSQELIEAMRYETEFDPAAAYKKPKSKRPRRLSAASNGLPNIDENDSQDENEDSGDDDMIINKNNRPSSDMFRPRKPDLLRKSTRNSARSSIMSSKIDEDIPGDEFDEIEEDDEIVAAKRAEALNNLTKPKRSSSRSTLSKQLLVEDPEPFELTGDAKTNRDSVVRKRVSEYEDIVRQGSKDKIINPETGEEEEIKDDASSVDSFTSANETNLDSKRGSSASKGNSKRGSKRDSSMPLLSDANTKISPEKIAPPKEFKDVSVQTDSIGRSNSFSTIHTFGNRDTVYDNALRDSKDGPNTRQSVISVHEDNNIDNRFTLDLSSSHRKNLQNQQAQLDPPPRPTNSPPPALMANAHRPTVNFGQQAGSSKIPHHPSNVGRKGSTDSQDNLQINNTSVSRSIGNGAINHQHTLSSGSVSTVSSTSTSAEQMGRSESSQVEAGSSTGPMTGSTTGPMTGPSGTDPNIIHAITQTMIGEYLWKYTRKNFGAGISEKRHKRFFWVHPYTKTLYWSIRDPGSYEPVDPKSKGGMSYFAYIESVKQVVDHNPSPPGLHHMSLVIKTPERELKFTARSKERHEYWFQALSYLLQRPDEVGQIGQGQTPGRITKNGSDPWENQANMQNLHNNTSPNGSLKGSNLREIKKKSSFSKLQAMFRRDGSSSSPTSPLSTEFVEGQHQQFAIPGPSNSNIDDDELEDLENVRQCCDGRHDVSKLERHKHHHHNHGHY